MLMKFVLLAIDSKNFKQTLKILAKFDGLINYMKCDTFVLIHCY
jgi:hypothetical protein